MSTAEAAPPQGGPPTHTLRSWMLTLWRGRPGPWHPIRSLIMLAAAPILINLLLVPGFAALAWSMPLKLIGFGILLLGAVVIYFGIRSAGSVLRHLGLKRLVLGTQALLLASALAVGFLVPGDRLRAGHWITSAGIVARWIGSAAGTLGQAIGSTPDTIIFAATGRRQPVQLPEAPWVGNIPPTPIIARTGSGVQQPPVSQTSAPVTAAPKNAASSQTLQIGNHVRVVGTDGAALRARTSAGTGGEIVARFPPGSVLIITGGPEEADGRVWWRVRGDEGEGWCAADYLQVIEASP